MKKFLISLVLVVLSANIVSAEDYVIVHRPGIGENLGNAVANVAMLPFAIVGGFAGGVVKGLTGYDEKVVYTTTTYNTPQYNQQSIYYQRPMPIMPMYYQQPVGMIWISGNGGHHRGGHRRGHHQR